MRVEIYDTSLGRGKKWKEKKTGNVKRSGGHDGTENHIDRNISVYAQTHTPTHRFFKLLLTRLLYLLMRVI